ncbi:RNA polymerase sigma-70 factor [Parabacteroides acidifaciens]|uniref:RNA polymerase sigma-70 factor n=1 Tax=Parabacteroides acidifaciens TaxID=2290935 RepID=A0A3D8HAZ6_9BACT|nr:RNA polymerase sigma-70 factor [Parabacteroides acidifaciens]MBC8603565.1 RNA polymerase sigma-70 factor [Parabacteroides acidifaciens]RDU47717.1 RNA polymerase sigma-70 factor [Parabacteroides acidifaciens]
MSQTDIHSFNALYTRYYRKAFLFTKSFVHDESVAEDIVSESLIKLWENLKEENTDHADALLLTILKNKSLDHLKHEAIKAEAIHSMSNLNQRELEIRISTLQACDPEEIFSEEVKKIIADTLATLPEQTRRIFVMSRFQNKSNKEIAEELGITVKGVEYHITKALKPLRISLKDYLPILYFLLLIE